MKQEDKWEYVNSGGTSCPYCGSQEIQGGFIEVDAGSAWQSIDCLECGKGWKDIYRLVDIEEE
uniref:Uncharacterized protein n=1 Tax=viral metagenome TaxID=1070528 RepID=A0A6M3M5T5_9ZZZZ